MYIIVLYSPIRHSVIKLKRKKERKKGVRILLITIVTQCTYTGHTFQTLTLFLFSSPPLASSS